MQITGETGLLPDEQELPINPQNFDALTDIYLSESDFYSPILRFPNSERVIADFHAELQELKQRGTTIGLVAGVFDIFHPNHQWYLIQVKSTLIANSLIDRGIAPTEITPGLIKNEMINTDNYALIVTVDGNTQVSESKGGKPEKGGVAKPIFDWTKRAQDVANVTVPDPISQLRAPVVRFVTAHDKYEFAGTPHQSDLILGEHIQPDYWFSIIEPGNNTRSEAMQLNLPNTKHIAIPMRTSQLPDPLTGVRYSSSGVINRIKGQS